MGIWEGKAFPLFALHRSTTPSSGLHPKTPSSEEIPLKEPRGAFGLLGYHHLGAIGHDWSAVGIFTDQQVCESMKIPTLTPTSPMTLPRQFEPIRVDETYNEYTGGYDSSIVDDFFNESPAEQAQQLRLLERQDKNLKNEESNELAPYYYYNQAQG